VAVGHQDGLTVMWLNRPYRRNAITIEMMWEITRL
jgi:hypothetical protein